MAFTFVHGNGVGGIHCMVVIDTHRQSAAHSCLWLTQVKLHNGGEDQLGHPVIRFCLSPPNFSPKWIVKRRWLPITSSHSAAKMGLKTAAAICALLGLFTSLACILSGPLLFQEMRQIRAELAEEMQLFKEQSDEIWRTILETNRERRARRSAYDSTAEFTQIKGQESAAEKGAEGGEKEANGSSDGKGSTAAAAVGGQQQPIAQQSPASRCNCAARKCPAGPKGPRGAPGTRGEDGAPGQPGLAGASADDVQEHIQQLDKCFHCPQGPPGPAGLPGRPGPRGMRGGRGQPGVPGRDGQPGFPGGLGPAGKPGTTGTIGESGIPGEDTKIIHGRPGLKGSPGIVGDQGDPGPPGPEGGLGQQGPEGDKGAPGIDGKNGEDGDPGQSGDEGEPGSDAEYCACPSRSSPLLANIPRKEAGSSSSSEKQQPKAAPAPMTQPQTSQPYKRRFHKQ